MLSPQVIDLNVSAPGENRPTPPPAPSSPLSYLTLVLLLPSSLPSPDLLTEASNSPLQQHRMLRLKLQTIRREVSALGALVQEDEGQAGGEDGAADKSDRDALTGRRTKTTYAIHMKHTHAQDTEERKEKRGGGERRKEEKGKCYLNPPVASLTRERWCCINILMRTRTQTTCRREGEGGEKL
eukprot:752931-Hanusia_phi.AAC.1